MHYKIDLKTGKLVDVGAATANDSANIVVKPMAHICNDGNRTSILDNSDNLSAEYNTEFEKALKRAKDRVDNRDSLYGTCVGDLYINDIKKLSTYASKLPWAYSRSNVICREGFFPLAIPPM